MNEWFFILAWLVPLAVFAVGVARFAKRWQRMMGQFENPEALANSIRQALEEAGHADGDARSMSGEVASKLGAGAPSAPPDAASSLAFELSRRAPYEEPQPWRWVILIALAVGAVWFLLPR